MSPEVEPQPQGLIQRAKDITLKPSATWARIAEEPATPKTLFTGYAMILGAVNPVCFAIGRLVFGERMVGAVYRVPIIAALIEAVIGYGLTLGCVWVLARLIEVLAAPFGALRDRPAAFKIAVYSMTAAWIGSVFYLLPTISILALVGQFYTLYLIYRGVQILLRPQGRTLGYVILVVVCYVVLMMLVISLTKLLSALA